MRQPPLRGISNVLRSSSEGFWSDKTSVVRAFTSSVTLFTGFPPPLPFPLSLIFYPASSITSQTNYLMLGSALWGTQTKQEVCVEMGVYIAKGWRK